MNLFRLFENRYLFKGDTFVGKFDLLRGAAFTFEPGQDVYKFDAFQYLQQITGAVPKEASTVVQDPTVQLKELPAEIVALKLPQYGMRTPAVMNWIRDNRPDDYRILYGEPAPETPEQITVTVQPDVPKPPVRKPRAKQDRTPAPEPAESPDQLM